MCVLNTIYNVKIQEVLMFEVLDQLIDRLLSFYDMLNEDWTGLEFFNSINLKKKCVADIQNEESIWSSILQYRKFMTVHQLDVLQEVGKLQSEDNHISVRIKQLNSIEYKIFRYNTGGLKGKIPINKCLNDLFGIRIIIDGFFDYCDLEEHIETRYPGMKLIDASKDGYIASHLYIMQTNQLFPWELQTWKKEDERNNLASHKLYKQAYTSWENNYRNC